MLNVKKDFLEEFEALTKEEKEARINTLTVAEIEVLSKNGYEFECNNGKITEVIERGKT